MRYGLLDKRESLEHKEGQLGDFGVGFGRFAVGQDLELFEGGGNVMQEA